MTIALQGAFEEAEDLKVALGKILTAQEEMKETHME